MNHTQGNKFLRLSVVAELTGYSKNRIYDLIRLEKFPKSIRIGARAVAWLESDVDAWMESRINASRKAEA